MMTARLIMAIASTLMQEAALVVIWRWGLPQLGIQLPLSILIVVMVIWVVGAMATYWIGTRALGRQAVIGLTTMIGSRGKAVSLLAPEGQVIIKGELWEAASIDKKVDSGEVVTVIGQDGLKLIVRKVDNKNLKGTKYRAIH
jgi:membrane-bound serine protease (ClpP class)